MSNAAASALSAEQAEAKRRLSVVRTAERDLEAEQAPLERKIADWRRELAKPRRAEISLVYEVGTPQPGGYLEFLVERQTVAPGTEPHRVCRRLIDLSYAARSAVVAARYSSPKNS